MTRNFTYTFKRPNGEEVTLQAKVTDRKEPRNHHKAVYAATLFNEILRNEYGYKRSEVTVRNIKEVQ